MKQTGVPIAQAVYGYPLQKITERERHIEVDPEELEVIEIFNTRAAQFDRKLRDVPAAIASGQTAAEKKVADQTATAAMFAEIEAAEKALAAIPKTEADAKKSWTAAKTAKLGRAKPLAGMPAHAQQYAADPNRDEKAKEAFGESRRNFLALVSCLMIDTAALSDTHQDQTSGDDAACRPSGFAAPEERWCRSASNGVITDPWLPKLRRQSLAGSRCGRSACTANL